MPAVIFRFLSCCALSLALLATQSAGASAAGDPGNESGSAQAGVRSENAPLEIPTSQTLGSDASLEVATEPGLQLSTTPSTVIESGKNERELLRLIYRTLSARDVQIENQTALAEMLLQFERDTEQLNKHAQQRDANNTKQTQHTSPSAMQPEGLEVTRFLAAVDPNILAVLGVLLLLLIIVRARRNEAGARGASPQAEPGGNTDGSQEPLIAGEVVDGDLEQETVLSLEVPPTPIPSPTSNRIPYRWQALLSRPATIPESRQLDDLAEIILSVGKVTGSDELLRKFIEAYPKLALELWIRLLETYREQGKREEFEVLSVLLNRNFNVECVPWDTIQSSERLEMTLQLLPHIRDRIDASWGHPECLDYLLRLLLNNRNGERHGFSLAVTKEILILIDLIAAESESKKAQA